MFLPRPLEGMLVGLVLFCMWYPFTFKKNTLFRNICIFCMFVYVGAIVSLTMVYAPPQNWNITEHTTRQAIWGINLQPLQSSLDIYRNCRRMGDYSDFIRLVGGNTVMLMPLGILVPILNKKFTLIKTALLGMAVSLSIEILQLGANILLGKILRTVEIDDFIQNSLGCIAGYIIFFVGRKIYHRVKYGRNVIGVIK